MKVVQAIAALAFLAVGAYGTAQFQNAITGATVNALTLTASSNTTNTATNWGITIVSTSPTYQGDGDSNGIHIVFNATFSGYLPMDGYGNPLAYLILPTAYVNPDNGGCATESQVMLAFGGSQANYETDVVYDAQNFSPLYTAAATGATGTIVLQYPPGNEVARKSFTFNVVAPVFTPSTAGISPSVSSFSLPTTAATLTTGANISIAGAVEGDYRVTLYYTATTGFPGIAWAQVCDITVAVSATTGSCLTTDFSPLSPVIGSWCGNVFTGLSAAGVTSFIAGNTLQLASVSIEAQSLQNQMKYFAGSSSPFNSAQITIAAGSNDVTPPVCTGATFATPLDVNTDTPQSRVLTIACNDGTGVGVAYYGAFAHAQSTTGITYESSVFDGTSTPTYTVPPHYSGSVSLVGIWAVDHNGNSVVYGRCISGAYTTICGGSSASSSSAVVASISLVIALILAVLAL